MPFNIATSFPKIGEAVARKELPAVISDPKDHAVIEAAVAGAPDVVCTADAHFDTPQVREFIAGHGVTVVSDRELIELLRRE